LALEVDEIAGEKPSNVVGSLYEIAVRSNREEVCVAKNRKLCLEPKQVPFCGTIQLTLFGSGVAAIALSDMAGYGESGGDQRVGCRFRFTSRAVSDDPKQFAAECNRFLPDLEVPHASSHRRKVARQVSASGINSMRAVAKRLHSMRRSAAMLVASCQNPCL
jgi:hypothetical protein